MPVDGDYIGAVKTVMAASAVIGDDAKLSSKAKEYEDAYVLNILIQVEDLLSKNDVAASKALLESAAKEFPDNDIIKSRIEDPEVYKTISLSSLSPVNGGFAWNDGVPGDPFGNSYFALQNYVVLHAGTVFNSHGDLSESYSAEYYINKQYSSLSFDIAPAGDFGASGCSSIKVYVDGILVYTAPTISQKTVRFNTGDIDVSQASYIKIVAEIDKYSCTIISNVLFKNAEVQ